MTKTSEIEIHPNWSPDGNAIQVYISSTNQLRILKATDGEVLLTQEKVDYWTWTPDGKEILIAFKDGQLNAVSIKSGKSRNIANWKEMSPSVGLGGLIYSPDGKKIVINGYQLAPVYKTHTFLFNVADGKITEVAANYDENIENIKWSPDSKWISYSSNGKKRDRLESTLWEADLTDFMKKMKPGTEKGFTTDFDTKTLDLPAGGVAPDGTFTDSRDGHVYKYKKIGTQTWMAENLNTDRFRNGDIIPEAKTEEEWLRAVKEGTPVWCYYDNDPEKGKKYGKMYNWYTMNDKRGLAPEGWHIPTKAEFVTLVSHVNNYANALKAIGEGFGDGEGSNTSGFSALLAGCRSIYGGFFMSSKTTFFCSSEEDHSKKIEDNFLVYIMVLNDALSNTTLYSSPKGTGYSVRCVKK